MQKMHVKKRYKYFIWRINIGNNNILTMWGTERR